MMTRITKKLLAMPAETPHRAVTRGWRVSSGVARTLRPSRSSVGARADATRPENQLLTAWVIRPPMSKKPGPWVAGGGGGVASVTGVGAGMDGSPDPLGDGAAAGIGPAGTGGTCRGARGDARAVTGARASRAPAATTSA